MVTYFLRTHSVSRFFHNRERELPVEQKTIKPLDLGGIAGTRMPSSNV